MVHIQMKEREHFSLEDGLLRRSVSSLLGNYFSEARNFGCFVTFVDFYNGRN